MNPEAVFDDVENKGAAEVLSRKLAAIEFAIMNSMMRSAAQFRPSILPMSPGVMLLG